MKRPTLQYIALGVLLAWALVAQLTYSGFAMSFERQHPPLPFHTASYTLRINSLLPGYATSGLHRNDEILAMNGQPVEGEAQLDNARASLHPDDILTITVRRNLSNHPEVLNIPVRIHSYPLGRDRTWALIIVVYILLPLSCIVLGFYIAFVRPRDPLAWITMGMLASFSQLLGNESVWALSPPWREIDIAYQSPLGNIWPLWMALFALYFPIPFRFIEKRRWLNWVIALPFIVIATLSLYGDFRIGYHARELDWLAALFQRLRKPIFGLLFIYVSAFFYLLGWKQRILKESDARRRLAVMSRGCSLALLPLLIAGLSEIGFIPALPIWFETVCLLMVIFFPLTMAYVIVVQRAMDVRMVVRTGVKYAFASNGIKILRIVLISALVVLTVHFERQSGEQLEGILIAIAGTAIIIAIGRIARSASQWLDRRFFREAYQSEAVLSELSNSVLGIRDTKTLLDTVTRRISESLHVPRIAVLLESDGRYQPAYAVGLGANCPQVELNRDSATIALLKRSHSPARIYFDDPQSWVHGIPGPEQSVLHTLDSQVLLPLRMDGRTLGVISLSPKKSEMPYSRRDFQLLSAVASQTALALENAHLTETIRQEIAQRERLDRELEIAREVQQRLFPQKIPKIDGLDLAGYCRPALGVGGDYYDFLVLPHGALGIAVGDVSGKGIAAALMMATLQASLRGQIIKPSPTLSEMIEHVNRLVYDASAENRYATFFYGEYQPGTRLVRYVNAGHNPPIIYRNSNRQQILRLEEGGTVVGIFPHSCYREGDLHLDCGDVLVAFTDGISEAMNDAEEEWGEDRLVEAIRNCHHRSAHDMIHCILEQVDSFTAGAQQHDDMTLVVSRIL